MTTPLPPDPPLQPPADGGTARILAELELVALDLSLPEATRILMRRAADALRVASADVEHAQLRYSALFDAVPDPVSVIAADGTVLDLNLAGMAAYRRPRHEVVGRPIHVLNPDLPLDHMVPVMEALDRGETYVIEVSNMRADGTRFPVEVHSAGFDHDGRRCVVAVARDLSRRREAEARYHDLMELIDKGIVIQSADGALLHANSAALRMFGPSRGDRFPRDGDFTGGDWALLRADGSTMPRSEFPALRALREGRLVGSTLLGLYHRTRRRLRWLTVTAVPHFATGGDRPDQVLSMFSDVTELKRDSALFDRVQSLAIIGGWEWDRASGHLYLTDEATRILAQAQRPATMDAMLACLQPGDGRRLRAALDSAGGGAGFELDLQGARGDGGAFWVRVIGGSGTGEARDARITGTLQDITVAKCGEQSLRALARSDPLTGLLNRDAMLAHISECLAHARRQVAVLYIDLDRFKLVNDVLGHAAGDILLTAAAARLRGAVGDEGLIARFGGDEFLVACDCGDDSGRPERLADAILEAFAVGFGFDKDEFVVTASIGIARSPQDGAETQLLIQHADAAMYESKRRTRNGRMAYTPALEQSQRDRLQFETQLRHAADNGEFKLVYQPQVELASGRTVGAEALIRWSSERLGEMRPDHFIAQAEGTGDIVRIGDWVLGEACRQVAAWRDAGLGIVHMAVNVSYRQLLGGDLTAAVQRLLQAFDLPGEALELEFTERVLIEDAPETLGSFEALRGLGVSLAIDDFGEGYSALNYLRRLPIQGLKLSQMFVDGVPGNQSDVAVCQAVAGIARSLGLGLVAEGIETEAQRRFLLELGVQVGQGFLFAPGLAPADFARRLQSRSPQRARRGGVARGNR